MAAGGSALESLKMTFAKLMTWKVWSLNFFYEYKTDIISREIMQNPKQNDPLVFI